MSSPSSYSSFEALNLRSTSSASIASEPTEQLNLEELRIFEDAEEKLMIKLNEMKVENFLRMKQCVEWSKENDRKNNIEALQTGMSGDWKPVSSINVEEFLARRNSDLANDLLFQLANIHIDFSGSSFDEMKTHYLVGHQKFHEQVLKLNEPEVLGSKGWLHFWSGDVMKSVSYSNGSEDEDSEERFVKNGLLHIKITRFGVTCTRIFEKSESSILKAIIGEWKLPGSSQTINFKEEKPKTKMFIQKSNQIDYSEMNLDKTWVKTEDLDMRYFVEDNKLMECHYYDRDEYMRIERWVENGKLKEICRTDEEEEERTYERIGDSV